MGQEFTYTSLVTDKSKQERVLHLLRQIPFKEMLRLLSIVSIVVFLAILALSKFFKSKFLRNNLLIGALTTLILGIIYDPITTLLLMLAILYTTYKIYEPDSCHYSRMHLQIFLSL
jgi:predicted membrane protein